jgi:RNA ligase (TIGR02306 family)
MGVVRVREFALGDEVEVYLQDALLPQEERFAFMSKMHYRVRIARFRGARSECLIMPKTVSANVGDEISTLVGVTKYEKEIPVSLRGTIRGAFPSFIPKTDELHFQSAPELVAALRGLPWYATEKEDGTSCTVYMQDGQLRVCSRNWEYIEDNSVYWQVARKYALLDVMKDDFVKDMALQFEIVGPGIQKNPLGLESHEMRLFDMYYYGADRPVGYAGLFELRNIALALGLPIAPVVAKGLNFDLSEEQLIKLAEGTYANGKPREGIVVRYIHDTPRISFKVINLWYED